MGSVGNCCDNAVIKVALTRCADLRRYGGRASERTAQEQELPPKIEDEATLRTVAPLPRPGGSENGPR